AGLTKEEIRALSRQMGLPTWDKPSLACLSSRFPYGTPITIDVLIRIAEAEDYLRSLGFRQLRVRHHDTIARIEVPLESIPLFLDPERREGIVEKFKAIGYSYVTLDLAGYRSGSMNEVLTAGQKSPA
ncbi:MAG: TIGR00268 family protein, partial [Dehalococcoidia bacterium]|nr:TIGR00268 family protein [Dehalococcoidia bacterium]